MADADLQSFSWEPQPAAAEVVGKLLANFRAQSAEIESLAQDLMAQTGTRLLDWVDTIFLVDHTHCSTDELRQVGFRSSDQDADTWHHPGGIFPQISFANSLFEESPTKLGILGIKVDCVEAFAEHRTNQDIVCQGKSGGPLRTVLLPHESGPSLAGIERHGRADLQWPDCTDRQIAQAAKHLRSFEQRTRQFDHDTEGFELAQALIDAAVAELGVDWACDLFFQAERNYWQARNHAAQVQFRRQQQLGLGWANHDHHTYRSSRAGFAPLVACLESLGLVCRERFYAGEQAGWGAQVMEQPRAGIVVFADVDLSPEEISGDFAHQGLAARAESGTVGTWCALHGESFLQAGMHHLECQFDFDLSREQLAKEGIETMAPFTDFSFLRQAFTVGEVWSVDPQRLASALASGAVNSEEAEQFRAAGAVGSHLEILERNDGYKGFNQTGVSDIIARTDPRKQLGN